MNKAPALIAASAVILTGCNTPQNYSKETVEPTIPVASSILPEAPATATPSAEPTKPSQAINTKKHGPYSDGSFSYTYDTCAQPTLSLGDATRAKRKSSEIELVGQLLVGTEKNPVGAEIIKLVCEYGAYSAKGFLDNARIATSIKSNKNQVNQLESYPVLAEKSREFYANVFPKTKSITIEDARSDKNTITLTCDSSGSMSVENSNKSKKAASSVPAEFCKEGLAGSLDALSRDLTRKDNSSLMRLFAYAVAATDTKNSIDPALVEFVIPK